MNLKQALHRYLIDPTDLPGHPAVPFVRARTVAGLRCEHRNDARRWLRSKVGGNGVFASRRPQTQALPNSDPLHSAIVLRTTLHDPVYDLAGDHGAATELLSVDVLTRSADAAARAETIADLLTLALSGYVRDYWGDVYIEECLIDSRSSNAYPPPDGSDNWTHGVSLPLTVQYLNEAAPVYPADPLHARITYGQSPGVGTEFRVSAGTTLVPEGREIATVAWELRSGSASGSLLVSFSGPAAAAVATSDVSGTYLEPAIDRAAHGITGAIWVKVTVTDSAGAVSITEGFQNG